MQSTNTITFKQAKTVLSKDIIERSDDGFVFQGSEGRIGWEKTLPKGSAYSDYLLSVKTVEEALTAAYRHASDMLVAMDLPKKVTIEVSHTEDSGWTDSQMVCLTTKFFDKKELTVGQKMDIFTGLAVHEGAHILYTDFNIDKTMSDFARDLENIIEDERIEHRLGDEKPGLANFLRMTKWYYFGEYGKSIREDKSMKAIDPAVRLVNAVIKLIRYPATLSDEEIREFAQPLVEVHDCLVPYPVTTREARKKAYEVEAILKKYIKEPPKQQGQTGDSQSDDSGDSGKAGSGGKNGNSGNSSQDKSQSGTGNGSADAGDKENGKNKSGHGNENKAKPLTEQEVKEILAKIAGKLDILARNPGEKVEYPDECSAVQRDPNLNKILSGKLEKTNFQGTVFTKVGPYEASQGAYFNALSSVRPYIPAMRNILRANSIEEKRTLTGMRTGTLDTNMLALGFQGVQSVYRQFQTVEADPITVCLLIDESGSMGGRKSTKAMETAVLIDEALKGLRGINLFIYGYTSAANVRAEIRVYREGGQQQRHILGALSGRGGTPTGESIMAVTDRIRKQTDDNVLLFVITDGQDGGSVGTEYAVKRAKAKGFALIGIGIESGLGLSQDFNESVELTDIASLPKDLGKIVKKAILRNSERHVA